MTSWILPLTHNCNKDKKKKIFKSIDKIFLLQIKWSIFPKLDIFKEMTLESYHFQRNLVGACVHTQNSVDCHIKKSKVFSLIYNTAIEIRCRTKNFNWTDSCTLHNMVAEAISVSDKQK